MRLVAGQFFNQQNIIKNQRSFIINETAAKLFGWADPMGKRIHFPVRDDESGGEIIGVVKDFHFESMHSRIEPLVIVLTNGEWGVNFVYVKTDPLASASLKESIHEEYKKIDPDTPFECEYLTSRYQSLTKMIMS